jgi:hypothetical protein
MSIASMVAAVRTDAQAWETVSAAFDALRAHTAERKRLSRMLEQARAREDEAATTLALALAVIKNRQECNT